MSGKQSPVGVGSIIAISSGKGGVGKSTIAVNLAVSLARKGFSIGLLDTDVYGPNVPIMVGVKGEPKFVNNRIIPHKVHGIAVMSLGFLTPEDKPVVWRGPMLHTAIRQFLYDVEWGKLDYLVVDMPPGTGDAQLSLAQLVPVSGAVVVTTPQEVALSDVRKACNMFRQVGIPLIGIVENMSYFECPNCSQKHDIFGSGGGRRLAKSLQTAFLGEVPLAASIRSGGDEGIPTVVGQPGSLQAKALQEIAENVIANLATLAATEKDLPTIHIGDSFSV